MTPEQLAIGLRQIAQRGDLTLDQLDVLESSARALVDLDTALVELSLATGILRRYRRYALTASLTLEEVAREVERITQRPLVEVES